MSTQQQTYIDPRVDVVFDFRKKATATTPGTVSVRVYFNRKDRRIISTGVRVLPSQWSDRWWVTHEHPDAAQLNMVIQQQVDKCRAMLAEYSETKQASVPVTDALKVDRSFASFLSFMYDEIEKADINEKTRSHHFSTLHNLQQWGVMRRFEDVTRENILAYIDYCRTITTTKMADGKPVEVHISQATVHDHWKRLRKYIRIAQAQCRIPMSATSNIVVPRGRSKRREFLTLDEMRRLIACQYRMPSIARARDRFLVAAGTGLSFSDLMSVDFTRAHKVGDHWVLADNRNKTDEPYFIVLLPFAVETLQRYGWQLPAISLDKYNSYLDIAIKEAGITKHVTSHVARHTYATLSLSLGARIEAVQKTLGHTKLETTQIYATLINQSVMEEFDKVLKKI